MTQIIYGLARCACMGLVFGGVWAGTDHLSLGAAALAATWLVMPQESV